MGHALGEVVAQQTHQTHQVAAAEAVALDQEVFRTDR